jgi:hypothetical protein
MGPARKQYKMRQQVARIERSAIRVSRTQRNSPGFCFASSGLLATNALTPLTTQFPFSMGSRSTPRDASSQAVD